MCELKGSCTSNGVVRSSFNRVGVRLGASLIAHIDLMRMLFALQWAKEKRFGRCPLCELRPHFILFIFMLVVRIAANSGGVHVIGTGNRA